MSGYDRRLGDVPGLADVIPTTRALPYEGVSVLEVNGLGEVTAGDVGLGDITEASYYNPDPFALGREPEPDEPAGRDEQGSPPSSAGGTAPSGTTTASDVYSSDDASSSPSTAVASGSFDEEQMANAAAIAEVGAELGASDRDVQIAIMAALVESQMRNLDYGDRDSIGMFQQRDAWGSFDDRIDPHKSARMFFLGGAAGQQGLLDIKDRDKRPMGDVAQDVQVSAYPDRYAEREADAASIMASLGGKTFTGYVEGSKPTDLTTYGGKSTDMLTAAALGAAAEKFGGDFRLLQGSHSTSVAASGSTHAGGGVVDLAPENGDWVGAMVALRKIGFAAWIRNVDGYGQAGSGAHIHAVLMDHPELSDQAAVQVQSYLNNDDGLAGSRPDDGPRDWVNNRFVWDDVVRGANRAAPGGPKAPEEEDEDWRHQVGDRARSYLGVDFKWGGEDHSGVDAVGLVRRVFSTLGVEMPRDIVDLAYTEEPISVYDARKGDLFVIPTKLGEEGSRLGVYLGNGEYIEAGGPGRVVQINALDSIDPMAWAIPMKQYVAPKPVAPYRAPTYTGGGGYNPVGSTEYAPKGGSAYTPPRPSGSSGAGAGAAAGALIGSSSGGGGKKKPKNPGTPDPRIPDSSY